MATLDILSAPASGELGSSGVMEREPYQDETFAYANHSEPLLSSHSSKYKKHSTSTQQPCPPQRSAVARTLGWSWSLVDTCYNRMSAWLFPNEPEPLDLQATIFFVSQAPIIAVVIWNWIPAILAWVFGIKTSEAGGCGKAQGMRKTWSFSLAFALSFLKAYLHYAENITIEECQSRARAIPFMTAPLGTRVNKVKVPSFPYRSRAEAIVYDCLSDQERDILSFRGNNYNSDGTQHDQHEKNQTPELIAMNSSGHETQQQQPHQAQFKQSAHSSDDEFEGLDAEWLEYVGPDEIGAEKPNRDNVGAILYFHGGGYYSGSKEEHRVMIGPLVKRLGKNIRIFIINYRLAPQNPFPAALVDALSSYMWLLDQSVSETFSLDNSNSGNGLDDKFQPNQIIFMGDSAGGGLALSLSLLLRDHGSLPQPLSIVSWSPWLDLTQSLPSFKENALTDCIPFEGFMHKHSEAVDKMFEQEESGRYHGKTVGSKLKIRQRAQVYCPDSCLRMKFVSPMFETDYRGIPSVFITCGSAERFTSECILMAARLEEQQQPCRIDIHEDMPHVFPLFRFHPSASTALDRTTSYIRDVFRESRANAFEDDIVIPISSASSSAFSSRASSPILPSDQSEQFATHASLDFSESVLVCPKASVAIDVTRGLTKRPYDINRTDSLSSLSSSTSEETASATSPSLFSRALSRSKRASHSSVYNKELPESLMDANMTARLPIKSAAKIRATVNVLNISGNSVMSFHRRDRYGHCDDPMSQQRRRRRSRLTLRDVVSDATLFEWEILLKQGYVPTRHWPHRPSPKK